MCKYFIGKENQKIKIAEEDITVYKAVRLSDDNKIWTAIYQSGFTAPVNEKVGACGCYDRGNGYFTNISGGMFHSCANLNTFMNRIEDVSEKGVKIVKCIIPKGTKYLASKVKNDICSEYIIVTNEVIFDFSQCRKECKNREELYEEMIKSSYFEHPEILEIVRVKGKKYVHLKDKDHEVYISFIRNSCMIWGDAVKACNTNGNKMPDTDDFDLIIKHRRELYAFMEKNKVPSLIGCFWSVAECNRGIAWFYGGIYGLLNFSYKCNEHQSVPVLAL